MRLLFLVLFVLLGLIQYPLWMGKGGWFKVWDLQRQVAAQKETNEAPRAQCGAGSRSARPGWGTGAVEERARGELGMMREGEVFVHILPQNATPPAGGASLATEAVAKPAATPARAGSGAPARPAAGAAASQGRPAASQSGSGARH